MEYAWNVKGGTIELSWFDKIVMLVYRDKRNDVEAEAYQQQLNEESV